MAAGRRVRGRESRQPRRRKHWLVAARWLRSSTEAATWDTAFICEPGAHRHRPQQSKTANTDTNMCTQTHRANSSHLHLTHNCWLRLALASAETLQSNILHESLLWTGIKQDKNHLKSRWFISERPRYDSVTLGYNLHTCHKFECFGNKRQIRTILVTPPNLLFIGGRSLSLTALTHLHGDQFVHRSIKVMHMLKQKHIP